MGTISKHPELEYATFLAEGRFCIQRSRRGGDYYFSPRIAVPGTGDDDVEWVDASGQGVVYSVTTVRNKPPTPDYNVSLIDLAEGPRMMSRVVGIAPGDVRIGMKVRARVETIDGAPAVVFVPETEGA